MESFPKHSKTTNLKLPVTNLQLPVTNLQLPVILFVEASENHRKIRITPSTLSKGLCLWRLETSKPLARSDQHPGYLLYRGDEILPSYMGIGS